MAVVTVLYSFYFPHVGLYLNFRKVGAVVDGDVPANPTLRRTQRSCDVLYVKAWKRVLRTYHINVDIRAYTDRNVVGYVRLYEFQNLIIAQGGE